MRDAKVEVLLDGLTFPEGPRWHGGRLWFSDFYTHRVLAVGRDGRAQTIADVPKRRAGATASCGSRISTRSA